MALAKMVTAAQDRKKAMLAVCLCLLAISVTYRLLNPFRQETAAKLTFSQTAPGRTPKAEPQPREKGRAEPEAEVRVNLLLNPPLHSGEVRRNIFQRLEETAVAPAAAEAAAAPAPEAARPPEVDKLQQVQEELSRFKTFGYLQGQEEKVLFLERGKDILLIREGDRIDGKYLVKRITDKQLIIRAESIGEDIRIELGSF